MAGIAISNARLHTRVKQLTEGLEQRVAERTEELVRAQREITARAQQVRLLADKTLRVQEEERARIARDMHDGAVQLISAARYELRAAKIAVNADSPCSALERLEAAREVLNEAESEMRRAIHGLHPPSLDALGLIPALKNHVSKLDGLSGLACDFQVLGTPIQLPPPVEITVFRVAEQALQNVVMHASAAAASVTLEFHPNMLQVTIQDDGVGFDTDQCVADDSRHHLGLVGMEQRVESHGGKMQVWSSPGQGTLIRFRLPLSNRTQGRKQRPVPPAEGRVRHSNP
jgi:two-component system sensor histidine kinase DegS